MAKPEHLARLREALSTGSESWNQWRHDHPEERIDLSSADLKGAHLSELDLRDADLTRADLRSADLNDALFHGATIHGADLRGAELLLKVATVFVPLWNLWRDANPEIVPDLRDEDFDDAELAGINLRGCRLEAATFRGAYLAGADFSFAYLIAAEMMGANLSGADLSHAYLCGADFDKARLAGANLQRVRAEAQGQFVHEQSENARDKDLQHYLLMQHERGGGRSYIDQPTNFSNADLRRANLESGTFYQVGFGHADLREAKVSANLSEADLMNADLRNADLRHTNLEQADLRYAHLEGAQLNEAFLGGANLVHAALGHADLRNTYLCGVDLAEANLAGADLREADLSPDVAWTRLNDADLTGADLRGANLSNTLLTRAKLSRADLRGANLTEAKLVRTDLRGAKLAGATVYGVSVWDVATDGDTGQDGLIITPREQPKVTVDDLEVAQFVYLLLTNSKIRDVIHTITSKAVLILGRFTEERKDVLRALHTSLKTKYDLVPIIFDFKPSPARDLTETVQLLANLCRFVIADLTDAKSIPQELSHIIPFMPSVPIQPIIVARQREYPMFEHWRKYTSVLPEFVYSDEGHLLASLQDGIIGPIERWEVETKTAAFREQQLRDKIKRLEAENANLRAQHNEPPAAGV